ncbi:hypothetical protein CLOM_g3222 [Closterium sp. NIES-68]|nr:hypothetical protein CLOM_g3222 [Closterium sp. NIES-68]
MNLKKILQAALGVVIILVIFVFVRELARETAGGRSTTYSSNSPANTPRKESPHEIIEQLKEQVAGRDAENTEMQDLEQEIQRLKQDIRVLSSDGGLPTGAHLTASDLKTAADVGVDATAICEQQVFQCKRQQLEGRSLLASNAPEEGGSASAPAGGAGGAVAPADGAGGGGGSGGGGGAADGDSSAVPPVSPAVAELQRKLADLRTAYDAMMIDKRNLTAELARLSHNGTCGPLVNLTMVEGAAQELASECASAARKETEAEMQIVTGGGGVGGGESGKKLSPNEEKLATFRTCNGSDAELQLYMNYTARRACPDDWLLAQRLMFDKNCFCLPRRLCFAATPPDYTEPHLGPPGSLFSQEVLRDENVRWALHECKSYGCVNTREKGECRNCFNMSLEEKRWQKPYLGTVPMAQVWQLKPPGSLRIGLDVGGGSGSFAAHMARYNVTILTTSMNKEFIEGVDGGLPYMETIALRGLVPLHVPLKARQPFFDNTLDIIHSAQSVRYFSVLELEELMFEWHRILRPGGIIWIELLTAPKSKMKQYVVVINMFKYKQLYWDISPVEDPRKSKSHEYLNCVLEKPRKS